MGHCTDIRKEAMEDIAQENIRDNPGPTIELGADFGYVILVATSTAILNLWQGMQVRQCSIAYFSFC